MAIKKPEFNTTPTANAEAVAPLDTISIHDLVEKINPSNVDYLKYFPDEFLNNEQKEGKKIGIERDIKKYETVKKSL